MYFSIGEVTSSDLNEEIIFNRFGWRHIFQKSFHTRSTHDRIRRFKLLRDAREIIQYGYIGAFRENTQNGIRGRFWTLCLEKKGHKKLKVVVRQINDGQKHFFSIMD